MAPVAQMDLLNRNHHTIRMLIMSYTDKGQEEYIKSIVVARNGFLQLQHLQSYAQHHRSLEHNQNPTLLHYYK